MEVGTIETIEDKSKKTKIRPNLPDGGGSSGGNDDGGGFGGDRNPGSDIYQEPDYQSNKFRIGMWFLLLVVMMTFGGLIAAYIVISTNHVLEWKPFQFPKQIWFSTAFLIGSSIAYVISKRALNNDNQEKAKNWLLATTVLGGMFVASQLLLWVLLNREGVYMAGNPYAGFFYILTAVHVVHVIGGIAALGYIVLRTWQPTLNSKELSDRKVYSNVISYYWHFMDGIWLVLVGLLGFWK
jgi:cytochrome c oxidase subunit III